MKTKKSMGNWKMRILRKQGKQSRTHSSPARRVAYMPPVGGWVWLKSVVETNLSGRKVAV